MRECIVCLLYLVFTSKFGVLCKKRRMHIIGMLRAHAFGYFCHLNLLHTLKGLHIKAFVSIAFTKERSKIKSADSVQAERFLSKGPKTKEREPFKQSESSEENSSRRSRQSIRRLTAFEHPIQIRNLLFNSAYINSLLYTDLFFVCIDWKNFQAFRSSPSPQASAGDTGRS